MQEQACRIPVRFPAERGSSAVLSFFKAEGILVRLFSVGVGFGGGVRILPDLLERVDLPGFDSKVPAGGVGLYCLMH